MGPSDVVFCHGLHSYIPVYSVHTLAAVLDRPVCVWQKQQGTHLAHLPRIRMVVPPEMETVPTTSRNTEIEWKIIKFLTVFRIPNALKVIP